MCYYFKSIKMCYLSPPTESHYATQASLSLSARIIEHWYHQGPQGPHNQQTVNCHL